MLRKFVVGAVIVGSAAAVFAAANRPAGYITICKIGETCSVSGSTDVAFGAADTFVHKTLNGSFTCSVATFGSDPIPSKSVKECSIPQGGAGGGGGAPPTNPTPPPSTGITGSSCGTNGAETVVHETIRVTSGTFDGGCRRFTAGSELGSGDQDEGQDPVFRVENGATLKNVVIGNNGADGIHVYNGGTIDNVIWMNVGEDALTVKTAGTVNIRNIEGFNADDKFFQINAASTVNVSNCIIQNAGKALRQNGGTTFRINVTFDRCDLNTMDEGIFRTDSSTSTVRFTNSRIHDTGTTCIGPWASCTQSGITTY
jgi:pectate lyase C